MNFRLRPVHLCFKALDAIHFPSGQSANVLRGAFGHLLRHSSGQALFRPTALHGAPSGLAEPPRPFVFRAAHLDDRTIAAGEDFWFGVNLFDLSASAVGVLLSAFRRLSSEGVGPARGRAELLDSIAEPISLSLLPTTGAQRIRIRFVTPTELKRGDQIAGQPDFETLASRARDRISTLRSLYDADPLDIDFRGFSERAARVRMTRCEIQHVNVQRRSSRTGQTHPIGGFTGCAEYEGELAEFMPYLQAAKWTGVGRQTVWGKGELAVEILSHQGTVSNLADSGR